MHTLARERFPINTSNNICSCQHLYTPGFVGIKGHFPLLPRIRVSSCQFLILVICFQLLYSPASLHSKVLQRKLNFLTITSKTGWEYVTQEMNSLLSILLNLQFNAWDISYPGIFENTGPNVQFNPILPGAATTINQFGTYNVRQLYVYWRGKTGDRSEHKINSHLAEMEIHLMHYKNNVADTNRAGLLHLVAVLGDVVDWAAIAGPMAALDVAQIQSNTSSGISVSGVVFDQLLPNNRDYFYYKGSLTTPPSNVIVQWFVLKERIIVPSAYLEQLREVGESDGDILEFNF